jgi:hypothetical protein
MEVATSKQLGSPFAATVRTNARSVVLPGLFALGRIARLSELAESWIRDAVDCGDKHMEVGARVLGAYRYVRLDDAARAQNEIALAAQIELDYVHAARTDPWWQARIWLYRGQPEQALAVCERMREGFGHYAAHSDPTRVEWFAIEGMCAATMAARGQHRERSMRLLERCARGARRAVSAGAPPVAAQLAASLCLLRGHNRAGLRQLERAVSHCDAQQLRLRAASLRLSLARLDARNAREHERRALRVFAEEGIAAPARWACMLAPGLAIDPFDEL